MTVDARNRPFSPQYPLWTDGATKRRWIRLPEGSTIDASDPDAWDFPVGTRLWKEFSFGRPVETRMIERLEDGTWRFAAYAWRADGSDADLAPEAGVRKAHEIRPGVHHAIPGRNDCLACHGDRSTPVLGFSALQLSPDRDPLAPHAEPPPEGALDLVALRAEGRLREDGAIEERPRIRARSERERAALGYLHANCGTCHGSNAALGSLGLSFEWPLARADGATPPALVSTVGVPSRFRPHGAPEATERVSDEHPSRSVVLHRMRSRSPLSQMPPLGTRLVDEAGLALVRAWLEDVVSASPQAVDASREARAASVAAHRPSPPNAPATPTPTE
jgi:mono/diheme cytochrome c family protein